MSIYSTFSCLGRYQILDGLKTKDVLGRAVWLSHRKPYPKMKTAHITVSRIITGGVGGGRTLDQRIKSPLLYH